VRIWFGPLLLLQVACSDESVRPPSRESGIQVDTLDTAAADQPRVVLRCEQGKVGAYIVVGPEQGSDDIDSSAVPVYLDSALSC
jgi:hypothetical protein